ncbi:MAG: ATP synthase subunit E [Chloroflexota bacterium]|nr:MAG: ATP synthase subunit E [Chloroflexota bacterium]
MSLEHILQALEAEAEQQIAEIEQVAEAQVKRILNQAQAEAGVVRQKHVVASQALLQVERTRLLNRAKQQASQIVLREREAVISSALAATMEGLAALSNTNAYAHLLRQLTQEAVDTLGTDEPLCLHVRERDVELMERIAGEMGLPASVTGDLNEVIPPGQTHFSPAEQNGQSLGGLAATVAAGRVTLNNTLEARLFRVSNLYRAQIAEIIFDEPGVLEG